MATGVGLLVLSSSVVAVVAHVLRVVLSVSMRALVDEAALSLGRLRGWRGFSGILGLDFVLLC